MTMTIDEALNQAEAMSAGLNWILLSQYEVRAEYASPEVSIDLDNRVIGDLSENVSTEGENNAEYISFIMDRYHDGVDLSNMLIQIQYELEDCSGSIDGVVNAYMNDDQIKFGWIVPPAAAQVDAVIKIMVFCTGTLGAKTYTLKTLPIEYTIHSTLETGGSIPEPDENWYLQFANTMQQNVLAAKESADAAAQSALETSDDLADIKEIQSDINSSKSTVQTLTAQVQSNTTKAQSSTDAAKVSEQKAADSEAKAKMYAENAEVVTGVGIASQTKAGLVKGGENYIDESGELQLTKRTDSPTLYNSYAGGIKLNELGGVSKQDSTKGAQLLNLPSMYVGGDGTVINLKNCGKEIIVSGTAAYAKGAIAVPASIRELIKGTKITFSGKIASKTISSAAVAMLLVITNADDTKDYYGVVSSPASVTIPEDCKSVSVDLIVNNTSTALSETNTVVFEDIMLNAGSTALPWEPYTGNAASPSPEYKQTIKPVEGKNLLDCRGLVEQTVGNVTFTPVKDNNGNILYININGTPTVDTNITIGTFMCQAGKKYIISGNGKSNKSLAIDTFSDYGSGATFSYSETTKGIVRIYLNANTVYDNEKIYPMIRPASIADDTYVPYGLLRFWGHGKNFLNPTLGTTSKNNITCTNNGNGTYTLDGTAQYATTFILQANITVNGLYKLIGCPNDGDTSTYFLQLNSPSVAMTDAGKGVSKQIDGTFELRISIKQGVVCNNVVLKPMLTTDLTATYDTYDPYTEQSHTLSTPIKLNGVGTAQDKIVRKDGVWKIERNIVEEVCTTATGIDSLGLAANIKTNGIPKGHFDGMTVANIMCDKFIPDSLTGARQKEYGIAQYGNGLYIRVGSIEQTVDAYNSWLAENPITVQYELATPTYEDLPTADQIALNSLVSYDGITYLYCDSEVQPTWDLEYGTSRVGGYTLECYNDKEIMKLEVAAMKAAQTTTEEVVE